MIGGRFDYGLGTCECPQFFSVFHLDFWGLDCIIYMKKQFNIGDFHHYNEDGKDTEDERYIVACDVSDKTDNFSLSVFDNEQGKIIEIYRRTR